MYHDFGEDSTRNAHNGIKLRAKHSKKLPNSHYREPPIPTAASRKVHIFASGAPTHIFEAKSSYTPTYTSYMASSLVAPAKSTGSAICVASPMIPGADGCANFAYRTDSFTADRVIGWPRRSLRSENETVTKPTASSSGNRTSVMAECCDGNTQLIALKNKKGLHGQLTQVV